jgi:hypothetical protein
MSMKEWRNTSEEGTADYVKAKEGMVQLKPLLKAARLYTIDSVAESYDNVKNAQAIIRAIRLDNSSENIEVQVDSL